MLDTFADRPDGCRAPDELGAAAPAPLGAAHTGGAPTGVCYWYPWFGYRLPTGTPGEVRA